MLKEHGSPCFDLYEHRRVAVAFEQCPFHADQHSRSELISASHLDIPHALRCEAQINHTYSPTSHHAQTHGLSATGGIPYASAPEANDPDPYLSFRHLKASTPPPPFIDPDVSLGETGREQLREALERSSEVGEGRAVASLPDAEDNWKLAATLVNLIGPWRAPHAMATNDLHSGSNTSPPQGVLRATPIARPASGYSLSAPAEVAGQSAADSPESSALGMPLKCQLAGEVCLFNSVTFQRSAPPPPPHPSPCGGDAEECHFRLVSSVRVWDWATKRYMTPGRTQQPPQERHTFPSVTLDAAGTTSGCAGAQTDPPCASVACS